MIWLLERVAGLLGSQGQGTANDSLPRGIPASPVTHYLRLTPTGLTSSSVITLQMPTTGTHWQLVSCQLHRTGGAAATWAPRFGQTAAFTDNGPDDRLGLTGQAFSTAYRKVFCSPVLMKPDGTNKLYFKPGLDAGSDNDLDIQLWFEQAIETEESS